MSTVTLPPPNTLLTMPKVSHRVQYSYGIIAFLESKSTCDGLLLPHKLPKCDTCYEKIPYCIKAQKTHLHIPVSRWSVLLIQRRQTMAYYDFLRAHYMNVTNVHLRAHFIRVLLNEMTCEERDYLKQNTFKELWKREQSFCCNQKFQYKADDLEQIYSKLDIVKLLEQTPSQHYATAEFGFPKGKAKNKECAWKCATREFCEETGYNLAHVRKMRHKGIVIEDFIATNGIPYRHLYYVMEFTEQTGQISYSRRNLNQCCEVQNLFWCPVGNVADVFRPYDRAKLNVLSQALAKIQ